MSTCPYCGDLKTGLDKYNIDYIDYDIEEHPEEYQLFSEITNSEYLPAFMCITINENSEPITKLYSPENNFENIDEAIEIIKKIKTS